MTHTVMGYVTHAVVCCQYTATYLLFYVCITYKI